MSKRTLVNDRSRERLEVEISNQEAAKVFGEIFGQNDQNWLWFWIHKAIRGRTSEKARATSAALSYIGDCMILAMGYKATDIAEAQRKGKKIRANPRPPQIRLHYKDQRFKIYLSKKGTVCIKSGGLVTTCSCMLNGPGAHEYRKSCEPSKAIYSHDPKGDEKYIGCLLNGQFLPSRAWNDRPAHVPTETEQEFLSELEKAPVAFMSRCSKDMNRCCYCNLPLEDPTSKKMGYGPICAKGYGLPWGDNEKYLESAPSFSKLWDVERTRGFFQAIRENPEDDLNWLALADWLEEHGLPRVEKATFATLPRS